MGIVGNLFQRVSAKLINPEMVFCNCHPDIYKESCGDDGLEIVEAVVALPGELCFIVTIELNLIIKYEQLF